MIIDGQIRLSNIPPSMLKAITKAMRLPNPTYQQAIRANPRARYTLSPYINYYHYDKETKQLSLPRGVEAKIRAYARRCAIQIDVDDRRVARLLSTKLTTSIKLRDYQQGIAHRASQSDSGIFRLGVGLGKTIIGIEIIRELQQKTLIIVPKLDLLNQWRREIEKFTRYKTGTIQGKNFEVKDITVATIQSLKNRIKENKISKDQFGCLIVDECHLFVPPKSRAAIYHFSSKYSYGLTGTCDRSDGQGQAIEWIFGDKLCDMDSDALKPDVTIIPFDGKIWMQDYSKIIEDQTTNTQRNKLIIDAIKREVGTGAKTLVLTKRVKHYEELAKAFDDNGIIEFSSGQKTKDRNELLSGLRDGSYPFKVIFGTFGLLSTGIDIPSLDTLIIAGDLKSEVLSTQSIGRILRILDGKEKCKIVDIFDKNNPILRRQGLLRQALYRRNGWDIEITKE